MKILDFLVHTGHQYEFAKLGDSITYIHDAFVNGTTVGIDKWNTSDRPQPDNIQFIKGDDVKFDEYDVLIVHNAPQLEYAFNHRNTNIPVVLLIHSYPPEDKQKTIDYFNSRLDRFNNCFVVYNSKKCQAAWSLNADSKVIFAGLDPKEWGPWKGNENGKIITVGNNLEDRPQVSGWDILHDVDMMVWAAQLQINPGFSPDYAEVKIVGRPEGEPAYDFEALKMAYRNCRLYFNPTILSPNPRGRIEAAMSGCPIVTTGHDCDWIIDGWNGFMSNGEYQLFRDIKTLYEDANLRHTFSERIRETAIKTFHIKRYIEDWRWIFKQLI